MASRILDSELISEIARKENELTGNASPVKGGPTAQAQKHANEDLDGKVVSDIAKGEEKVTHKVAPVAGGPTALAQSKATREATTSGSGQEEIHTGKLDSKTISEITRAETKITGQPEPVKGGPTAQAQKHANEPINSKVLHDITEGEKKVTGGKRVAGGPTSTAQSELAKSRQGRTA
ncbi:hypothetical protein SLS53_004572 [Cytospora paraplurivora]|uniref:SMP domain-containing protein n=1 Tax=Cytospora paraplurivora TaxID=2898453 RepID=A0AAN9UA38_9PEZI